MFNFIQDNNLLTEHQSGFKPNDSTLNQLSYLYHTFSEAMDKRKEVQVVFCDISKAFDSINHDFIYEILEFLNFGPNFIRILKTMY